MIPILAIAQTCSNRQSRRVCASSGSIIYEFAVLILNLHSIALTRVFPCHFPAKSATCKQAIAVLLK
ncbi:MAG: hypothetical protein ACM37W_25895 [Actinomycetota bacterium]